jgi:hypothetical protein
VVKKVNKILKLNLSTAHQPTPRRKRKALRTETLSHKFEKATERSSFQIYGGVVVLVCKLAAVGGLGAEFYTFYFKFSLASLPLNKGFPCSA